MKGKTRILIVDDDISFACSLSDILSEKGHETWVVNNGEDAISKSKEITFNVILMDIKMPVMDGVETFKRIKKISPKSAVIMMTAYSVEELIKDALKEGAYGVLPKPLDIDQVVGMVETAEKDGCLVMVVDDDPNIRESLKDVLEHKGFVVTLASDGKEAIKIIKERPEDIIFIDMKLPVLNGLETYLALREVNPKITAIIMTAYRQEMKELIEQALAKGAYSCLYKPFDPKEILDIIGEIIKQKNASFLGERETHEQAS